MPHDQYAPGGIHGAVNVYGITGTDRPCGRDRRDRSDRTDRADRYDWTVALHTGTNGSHRRDWCNGGQNHRSNRAASIRSGAGPNAFTTCTRREAEATEARQPSATPFSVVRRHTP
jgi:hypothetical protein